MCTASLETLRPLLLSRRKYAVLSLTLKLLPVIGEKYLFFLIFGFFECSLKFLSMLITSSKYTRHVIQCNPFSTQSIGTLLGWKRWSSFPTETFCRFFCCVFRLLIQLFMTFSASCDIFELVVVTSA